MANTLILKRATTSSQRSSRQSVLLFMCVFCLIFGPRIYGTFLFDVISLVSILVIFLEARQFNFVLRFPKHTLIPVFILIGLIFFSLLVSVANGELSIFYPLKFARTLLNYLAVVFLFEWFYRRYREDALSTLLEYVFWAISLHALIMLVQFVNTDLGRLIADFSGFGADKLKSYRVSGLTISYNMLAIVQGFGLLLAITLHPRLQRGKKFLLYWIATTMILLSLFIAGRTAAYVTLAFALCALLFSLRRYITSPRTLIVGIIMAVAVWSSYDFLPNGVRDTFETYTLQFFLDPVYTLTGEKAGSDSRTEQTIEKLVQFAFFPEDTVTLLFGTGSSGRDGLLGEDTNVESDIGYILSIWGIGVVGTSIMLLFYVYTLLCGFAYLKYDRWVGFLAIALSLTIMIVNAKEQEFFTRHAFTLTSILLCGWYAVDRLATKAPTLPPQNKKLTRLRLRPTSCKVSQSAPIELAPVGGNKKDAV